MGASTSVAETAGSPVAVQAISRAALAVAWLRTALGDKGFDESARL
jgi:hypothetical protein